MERGAHLLAPLHEILRGYKKSQKAKVIDWSKHAEAEESFEKAKQELAKKTLLQYPSRDGILQIKCDASEIAVGGVIEEIRENNVVVPLGFFSRKLDKREQLLSTFFRELLAIYLTMKHFRYLLEGQTFNVYTDHAALVSAASKSWDRPFAREARMLAFISQYNAKIIHLPGKNNVVGDALSRPVCAIEKGEQQLRTIDYAYRKELIEAQATCDEIMKYVQPTTESIQLTEINGIYVEKIKGRLRPFVPKKMRKIIFDQLHGMAHGGIKATRNLICTRFVWPNVKRDVAKWTKACINCQKAKVTVHNRADMSSFEENISEKWRTWHIDIVGRLEDCDGYQYI